MAVSQKIQSGLRSKALSGEDTESSLSTLRGGGTGHVQPGYGRDAQSKERVHYRFGREICFRRKRPLDRKHVD